jgi:hypothetical protein
MSETLINIDLDDHRQAETTSIDAEKKITDVLAVKSSGSEAEEEMRETYKEEKTNRKTKYKAPGQRNRKFLIKKLKDILIMNGKAPEEIRAMNLGRRRKNSITSMIGEEVRKRMESDIQQKMGIPESEEGKKEYAVDLLVRCDLTLSHTLEKGLDYFDTGFTMSGFTDELQNPNVQREMRSCFSEFVNDPENFEMVQAYCGPWTRLAMLHFYGAMKAVRKVDPNEKKLPKHFPKRSLPPAIPLQNLKGAALEATFRKNLLPYPEEKPHHPTQIQMKRV